ncbi:hypothetical protein OQZ55_00080 [Bacillus subtilis]|uniref:hypothetical protein n=1 Tax=Bacillus subtilis TaxID=1423 RepID=UPI00225A2346|nr:hypothetical protein [Bacillus subtilis]MCX4074712.1 hypothetical protein [Bacillus subtilis]MEC0396311.1 hypothetical protein [Bacillus subtilis]
MFGIMVCFLLFFCSVMFFYHLLNRFLIIWSPKVKGKKIKVEENLDVINRTDNANIKTLIWFVVLLFLIAVVKPVMFYLISSSNFNDSVHPVYDLMTGPFFFRGNIGISLILGAFVFALTEHIQFRIRIKSEALNEANKEEQAKRELEELKKYWK